MRIESVGFEIEPWPWRDELTVEDVEWTLAMTATKSLAAWRVVVRPLCAVLYARYLITGPKDFRQDGTLDRRGVLN